jgi:hypothetical protein
MKLFSSKKEEVRAPRPFLLEEDDLLGELTEKKGTSLFLGKFALHEVEALLRKRNFYREAKRRGLWPLLYRMDSTAFPPLQRLQIFFERETPDRVVVDLKIREARLHIKDPEKLIGPLPESGYIVLEWLTLQNPLKEFAPEKTPLPGQKYPGLGLGHKVADLFIHLARITKNGGILAFPAYFHNALLFSRRFMFLNPSKAGEVSSILTSLPKVPFKELAWIVFLGCLRDELGKIYEWKAEEQIFPLSQELKRYFDSPAYKKAYRTASQTGRFYVDWDRYMKKKEEYLKDKPWPESD